jgi:Sulfotransferase family
MPAGPPPHFVCIGAQKAGTQWLYDQVASHPDAWMPTIKELRFWYGRWPRARQEAIARLNVLLREVWRGQAIPDPRDIEFLRRMWFETNDDSAGDLKVYRRILGAAAGAVTGDVSPQYSRLEDEEVDEMLAALPGVPIAYFVREPVSRVWSQISMQVHWDDAKADVVEDPDALAAYLQLPAVTGMSFQSQVINRWADRAIERFRVFPMDEMIAEPDKFRRGVFEYIGLDPDRCDLAADYNKEASQSKRELRDDLRQVILDFLGNEPDELEQALMRVGARQWPGTAPVPDASAQLDHHRRSPTS